MVAKPVKEAVHLGEEAVRLEKRGIARHSLVQQIDRLQQIGSPFATEGRGEKEILAACVKIECDEVGGWLALNGPFLSSRDLGVQAFRHSLRDLALDGKHVVQIAIVLLGPYVGVGASVDQLRVQVSPITAPACAF